MTELILIRHGETDWNRELRFQGHIDVPLNDIGHEQARRVAARLSRETVHHLVSSDLTRAQQTARPVGQLNAQALPLDTVTDAALREQCFGVIDGMRVADIKVQYPAEWAQWVQFQADFAFSGGESTRQFHARVMASVQTLAQQHAGQTLVVVTHGGVLDMIYRTALSLPLSGPRQSLIPNAGLSRVRIQGDVIEILSWADTQHLADMPAQPVYDQGKLAAARSLTA